jgi:hypothetical protein
MWREKKINKKPFRKICQTKNLPDSDPDLTSSSLVTFGPNLFEIYISQGGLYYFTFNIRLHVKFWM